MIHAFEQSVALSQSRSDQYFRLPVEYVHEDALFLLKGGQEVCSKWRREEAEKILVRYRPGLVPEGGNFPVLAEHAFISLRRPCLFCTIFNIAYSVLLLIKSHSVAQ
jgi:hypothetical protein